MLVRRHWRLDGETIERHHCPQCGVQALNQDGIPLTPQDLTKRAHCRHCQSPLWSFDRAGTRRFALADYIARYYPHYFDLLIGDEAHEYKARGSAQGLAFATLISKCRRTLALTGTLSSGRSTSLFHLMWRLIPALRTVYAHHEEARWVDHFGVWETRTADVDTQRLLATGRESKRREYVSVRERPGISPHVIPLLVDKTAFLQLRDLGIALPPYQEEIHECPLNDTLASHYLQLKRAAPGLIQDARKTRDGHLLSSTIQALVAYPDRCWLEETLRTRDGELKFALPALPTTEMYPKEQALVNLVAHNRREQRRVLVFCTHTQTRDITHRLTMLLERAGYRASTLPASVRPERRMQWIQTRVEQGLEVLICNPRLVGTGLDLIDFPTVIWMEPEYSVYQVRQASRRSWRIGQTRPVTVTCLVYRETMQEHAWSLIASGIKASLQVEGDLTADGMCTYHQTDDILTQLIHSVLNANHQLPSAEKLFRELCALYALSSPGQASHTPRPPLNGSPCRALPPHVSTPSPEQAMTHPIQLTLFAA